ncbi:MAG: hypothetical protein Q7J73_00825 [Dehalococcoidales bacterium]|nr:hypothetical protein [Dehalococcoidales bacterium]
MGKWRRRNYQLGGSRALTYPSDITVGEEASVAGSRLLLIDPRGEIDENDLEEFLEKHVEPVFWKWWEQKKAAKRPKVAGVIRTMEAKTPTVEKVLPVQTQDVNPGPPVYLINCWNCSGQIAWRVDLGTRGGCPYCGAWLQLTV